MTYMKMTRGPESSTSLQPTRSKQPSSQKFSIKDTITKLITAWSSGLISFLIVMNLLPATAADSSSQFSPLFTVGDLLIIAGLASAIYSATMLIRSLPRALPQESVAEPTSENKKPSELTANSPNQLLQLTRSAEQLSEVEMLLIQKIGANHRTDRVTDKLICQLQICTNRMMAQIGNLNEESNVLLDSQEALKSNIVEKEKTTLLSFWL